MAQEIHRTYALPVAPSVFLEVLRSRETIESRCAAEGLGPTTLVAFEAGGATVRIVVSSEIPTSWLPSVVTSRLSGTPHVVREERWESAAGAGLRSPLTFDFAGLPVRCEGSATVQPEGAGSRLDVDVVLHVDVPFLGGTVERAVAPQVEAALDTEGDFYQRHLTRQG